PRRSAAASAKPRASATSRCDNVRPGVGALTALPAAEGASQVKLTSTSGSAAIARVAPARDWQKASSGLPPAPSKSLIESRSVAYKAHMRGKTGGDEQEPGVDRRADIDPP